MNQDILLAMPSTPELLIVLFIVLVIFGGSKIPKLMGGFGKGIKDFKKAVTDEDKNDEDEKKVLATSETTKQLNENSES
jgi:sec-independent protein translocase protein TatA